MNLLELVDSRNSKVEELNSIINLGMTEKRKLNEDETLNIKQIDNDINELDRQISEIQALKSEIKTNNRNNKLETKMENRKSLVAQINERRNGKTTDAIELSLEERAVIAAETSQHGEEIVGLDVYNILAPLRAKLVLSSLGATFMTGLKNNIKIPLYSGSNAVWEGENDATADGAGTMSKVELSPKRISAYVDISKQLLAQDTVGAENLILNDIVVAVAQKLESTIFGHEDGSATQPEGLFATGNTLNITGTTTYTKIVELETAVDTGNALQGNLKYVTNASGKGLLKSTPKISGSTFPVYIMDGKEANGYEVVSTNNVADDYIVFANWNDFVVAQWGAVELTVDPYTQAASGMVRIVVNAYFDAAKKREASFAIGKLA
jgi:HK97 family phage major capsid protein